MKKVKAEKRNKLIITEIPYTMIGAGIGKFISDVIDLVETKRQQTLLTFQTAQNENGIRIVLELKKGADVEKFKKYFI